MSIYRIFWITSIFFIFSHELFSRNYIIIQSTTSTENSGLLDIIEKEFEKESKMDIRFVASGTGQAIASARKGNADLLLVHSIEDEISFINDGYGLRRYQLMYNDFVIVGPKNDPASLKSASDIIEAMQKIALNQSLFLSRNDKSGTHKKELTLWKLANIDIVNASNWYLKNGLGMGVTLNMASELDAYTLTDRGTWLSFNNKKYLKILFEKDKKLNNPYGIILVNPVKFPHMEYDNSIKFINWLLSDTGKAVINSYSLYGKQLFFTY